MMGREKREKVNIQQLLPNIQVVALLHIYKVRMAEALDHPKSSNNILQGLVEVLEEDYVESLRKWLVD